ncbi:MAG: hypothetical protein QXI84_04450 [Thermofilaceae archaeon]
MSAEGRLREILEEIVETLRASPDPFRVRVRELLDELASLLPKLKVEELPLDAELIYRLAEVVRRQEEWLASEASAVALGRLVAALKVHALGERELALQLLGAWRPIVELEQVTFTDILRAVEYMGGRKPRAAFEGGEEQTPVATRELAAELGILSQVELEKVVERVRERLNRLLEVEEAVSYAEAVRGGSSYETYLNAYALSLLASSGEFSVVYDPLADEFYVTRSGGGEASSLAIPLEQVVEDAR